jgi:hypothetical protein
LNTAQKLVVALGVVLLVLNFTFPFTSYPVKQEIDGGQTIRYTARTGFVPLWKALDEHQKSDLKGNVYRDTIIQWPVVIVIAVAVVVICGRHAYRLRTRSKPPVT